MTEIVINRYNRDKYSNGSYPEVITISWTLKELDKNIVKNFPNLTFLYCSHNQITNLSPLQYCSGLNELHCTDNQITDLSPLRHCTRLIILECSYNQITDLSPLRHCKGLIELDCSHNQITDLSPLQYCTGLTKLHCDYNQIIDLSPLQHSCTGLNELHCDNNQITSLEPLIYLRRLRFLFKFDNPLNPPSIQVVRLLERIVRNRSNYNNSIYSDTQNVHDVKVQQSVMDSVRNLMKDGLFNKITFDMDSVLTSELKASTKSQLLEYFEDNEPHVILLITYKELFTYVWNRIINNPPLTKLELLKILDDNIQDSECKCFTGRFNRTLSTLVGFYDDIEINISDNSRISAIILQVKDSIIPYDVTKHRELSKIRLLEAGYDSETVELWISAIE